MSKRTSNAFLAALVVVASSAMVFGPQLAAGAQDKPAPPKAGKPPGKVSALAFDQYPPSPNDDVVLRWNEAVLAAIRTVKPGPTVVARALAVTHTAIYDAWAPYDPAAVGTQLGGTLRRPPAERTDEFKSKAISYAAYRAATDLFPTQAGDFKAFMVTLGYDPDDASTNTETPEGIGNVTAKAVLEARHRDGSNQLGDEPGSSGRPYSDWTGYRPVNTWDTVTDPYRWQPLCVPTPPPGATTCAGTVQSFATPQWNRVTPFALARPDEFGPPVMDRSHLPAEAKALVDAQAKLSDADKTSAYYWADGPGSELPPGHWSMFAQATSRAAGLPLDQNVKAFFALSNALLDASIATWNAKRVQDTSRPITYIRWLYAGKKIKGWLGPGKGVGDIDGSKWLPYQEPSVVTPAFAEYTSGHSAFSSAASSIFNNFAGSDTFKIPLVVSVKPGTSTIEPGLVPAKSTVLKFKSFTDAGDQAGLSRRYGGIHFEDGDLNGRAVGARIGNAVWAKAQTYFTGTAG